MRSDRSLLVALLAAAAAGAVAGAAGASACSVVRVPTTSPHERPGITSAAAVYGAVITVRLLGNASAGEPQPPDQRFEAKVRVSRVYKGRVGRVIRVRSYISGSLCGTGQYRVGQHVALFLSRPGPPFTISSLAVTSLHTLNRATGGRYHRPGP